MRKKPSLNRRSFLKTSVMGSGALLATHKVLGAASGKKAQKNNSDILVRKLGNTGIVLPVISAGKLPSNNAQITIEAYNKGVKYFDTAFRYDDGKHEEMLGKTLPKFKRESYVLGTKIVPRGLDWKDDALEGTFDKEKFFEEFDISLKRLNVEYVDILFIHGVKHREVVMLPSIMEALQTLKNKGLIKHAGVSTHSNEPVVLQAAIDSKFYEVVMTSYNFKQKHLPDMEAKIKSAADAGIGIIGMKVMAGGFLDKDKTQPINYKAAMKWALKNPNVCTLIPQMKTYDQLEMNTSIMGDITLTDEELKDLALAEKVAGLYCDGCGVCTSQCPKGLPIPDLMRSYMYSYGYAEYKEAQKLVQESISNNNPCSNCTNCNIHCVKGFNVAEKISDISRIYNIPNEFLV